MNQKFLNNMLEAVSVSGHEESIQNVIKNEMENIADKITIDEMNNLICVMNPESDKRIMLSAHADEIGLIISNITDDGKLQTIDRGGIIPHTYPGQQICVKSEKGYVYGVVETYRELLKKPDLSTKDFIIDIGAETKEEALSLVDLGDPIVLDTHVREMYNGRFTSRACDDKIGVYIIMEAFRMAKERGCNCGVYSAATVGEETTKNGAYWCSQRIKPDLAIVVDVTYTSDCIGMDPAEMGTVELGKGPVLCNSPIVAKRLNKQMEVCAEQAGIRTQREAASRLSYTDADKIHFSNDGVPVVTVSIPLRYMHTPAEVADKADIENCAKLIAEFLVSYK